MRTEDLEKVELLPGLVISELVNELCMEHCDDHSPSHQVTCAHNLYIYISPNSYSDRKHRIYMNASPYIQKSPQIQEILPKKTRNQEGLVMWTN